MHHRLSLGLAATIALASLTSADAAPYANGSYVNGSYVNGSYVNGRSFSGVGTGGSTVAARVEGSRLFVGSSPVTPGMVLHSEGFDADGNPTGRFFVRVDGVRNDGDRYYYRMVHGTVVEQPVCRRVGRRIECEGSETIETYSNLCDAGAEVIPFAGTWDYRQGWRGAGGRASNDGITLACVSGALGKCIDQLNYEPWISPTMALAHEACVRMTRGDYCGNGTSFTQNGTPLEVADTLTPQIQTLGPMPASFELDTAWTASGPICVVDARYDWWFADQDDEDPATDCWSHDGRGGVFNYPLHYTISSCREQLSRPDVVYNYAEIHRAPL